MRDYRNDRERARDEALEKRLKNRLFNRRLAGASPVRAERASGRNWQNSRAATKTASSQDTARQKSAPAGEKAGGKAGETAGAGAGDTFGAARRQARADFIGAGPLSADFIGALDARDAARHQSSLKARGLVHALEARAYADGFAATQWFRMVVSVGWFALAFLITRAMLNRNAESAPDAPVLGLAVPDAERAADWLVILAGAGGIAALASLLFAAARGAFSPQKLESASHDLAVALAGELKDLRSAMGRHPESPLDIAEMSLASERALGLFALVQTPGETASGRPHRGLFSQGRAPVAADDGARRFQRFLINAATLSDSAPDSAHHENGESARASHSNGSKPNTRQFNTHQFNADERDYALADPAIAGHGGLRAIMAAMALGGVLGAGAILMVPGVAAALDAAFAASPAIGPAIGTGGAMGGGIAGNVGALSLVGGLALAIGLVYVAAGAIARPMTRALTRPLHQARLKRAHAEIAAYMSQHGGTQLSAGFAAGLDRALAQPLASMNGAASGAGETARFAHSGQSLRTELDTGPRTEFGTEQGTELGNGSHTGPHSPAYNQAPTPSHQAGQRATVQRDHGSDADWRLRAAAQDTPRFVDTGFQASPAPFRTGPAGDKN